jgi:hypothetical protein
MKIGLLWFDNDPKTDLKAKLERAAGYYAKKYGQAPDVSFVHPSLLPAQNSNGTGIRAVARIKIEAKREIRPNHFWIGVKA